MRSTKNAFTLVEILIVVVILGIIAAIVIPQVGQTSANARQSSVQSNLQTIRSQIEVYKIQHLDTYPGASIMTLLTSRTNSAGATGSDPNLYPCGPYMLSIPANPYVSGSAGTTINTGTATVPGDGSSGWYWETDAFKFSANDATNKNL